MSASSACLLNSARKVDQSFIKGLPGSRDSLAIVRAIISLAKTLDFTVTAEGVETVEQAILLKDLHCDKLQGYYFSKPVPAGAIPALLSRRWVVDGMTIQSDQSLPRFEIDQANRFRKRD